MAFPVNFATQIRSQVAISSVIAKKVKLKKKGKDFLGLCPFHQEKTPSFTVNDAKGLYYCFGCGAGGDVVKFVSETEKLTYGEAIKKLAYDFNLELPKNHKTSHNGGSFIWSQLIWSHLLIWSQCIWSRFTSSQFIWSHFIFFEHGTKDYKTRSQGESGKSVSHVVD